MRRVPHTSDRRKLALSITARGARTFAKLAGLQRAELRRVGPDLARIMEYFSRASDGAAHAS